MRGPDPIPLFRCESCGVVTQPTLLTVSGNCWRCEPPIKSEPRAATAELARRELRRRRLMEFVRADMPAYQPGWVHYVICDALEEFSRDVVDQKSPRLMIFMPPRHGKSTLAAGYFPAWHMGRAPHHEIVVSSYSHDLAKKFSRDALGVFQGPMFKSTFPNAKLDSRASAVNHWYTKQGGSYFPVGVGGSLTGRGAHALLVDDPVKNREEAESPAIYKRNWDWWRSTARTRLHPGAGALIIQTRWSDNDLSGMLLDPENALDPEIAAGDDQPWKVLEFKAIADEDEPYRKAGEALHPDRYDLKALAALRRDVGPREWAALFQQDPVADDGAYFSRDDFRPYPWSGADFSKLRMYTAWDLAIGMGQESDWTVGVTVGVDNADTMYIVDVVRGRWNAFEIVENMIDVWKKWKSDVTGVEAGHIELALGPILRKRQSERRASSMYVEPLKAGRRDKISRARSIQGRMKQGRVMFPDWAPWMDTLTAEMLRFPVGRHDDQVDALAWLGLMLDEISVFRPSRRTERNKERPDTVADKIRKHLRGQRSARGSAMAA